MFQFLCKSLLHSRNGYIIRTLHNPSMVISLSLIRYFSSEADNPHSFTLSYLTQTCGLSPKSALSASKTVQFESLEQPDSVISSLENFGFSKIQISEMIRKYPKVLCCKPEQTISPKVQFFLSRGVSTLDLVTIFTSCPWIFRVSLENHLVGIFNLLIELFQSKYKVIEFIKRNPWVLSRGLEASLVLNIKTLRDNGVPASNILWVLNRHWVCLGINPVRLGKIVEEVKEVGFDPLKLEFVRAAIVLKGLSKSKWDEKVEVYKRWDWSDNDITAAFRKFPLCMSISEDKIMAAMDFYVNKLGLESSVIVNRPVLLGYSLKKRLIPRGAVIQYLLSKGFLKVDSRIATMFDCSDKCFLEKYVNSCKEEAPNLIKLYNEKLNEAISETKSKS